MNKQKKNLKEIEEFYFEYWVFLRKIQHKTECCVLNALVRALEAVFIAQYNRQTSEEHYEWEWKQKW